MSTVVDTGLLADIKRFGPLDVSACFSCGNCTAICPLSDDDGTFPRRIIRYAQVGMKDSLLSSKELWTCYHCGLCSETCPTEADPGAFMAAARRYAIASYDRTRLARTLYTRPVAGSVVAVLLALFFALFMYADHGPRSAASLELFTFVPEGLVHWTGVAVMILMTLAGAAGVVTMARGIARAEEARLSWRRAGAALWTALGIESLGQRRYRADCKDDGRPEPLWRRRWLVHALTVWGFLGLLTATILDYALALAGVKETGAHVALWYPPRLIGTIAGAALVYGVSVLILNRLQHANQTAKASTVSDWLFPVLLWVTGVTGFLLEAALYLPHAPGWGYWVFLLHVSVAMELMLLLPFIKFAHALYRPVALFFLALRAGENAASPLA
jgi:quinone-modifying oxidoreductase, subunit QmoC